MCETGTLLHKGIEVISRLNQGKLLALHPADTRAPWVFAVIVPPPYPLIYGSYLLNAYYVPSACEWSLCIPTSSFLLSILQIRKLRLHELPEPTQF